MSSPDDPRHPITGQPLKGAAKMAHERGIQANLAIARRQQMKDTRAQILKSFAGREKKK